MCVCVCVCVCDSHTRIHKILNSVITEVKFEEFAVELTHKTSRIRDVEKRMGITKKEKKHDLKIK